MSVSEDLLCAFELLKVIWLLFFGVDRANSSDNS